MSAPQIDVVLAEDAIDRLAAYAAARRWHGALLVSDANTREAAAARAARALRAEGVAVLEHVFPQRHGLLPGPIEAEGIRERLRDDVWPVAVGSGVITDIVRHGAHAAGRDFVSVPTAASMDGYASSVAAMQIDGVKVTYPSRAPTAIFADPRVAARAPSELTRAGIGDLLAKATCGVDWLVAHLLYDETYAPEVADRVRGPLGFASTHAEDVLGGDPAAITQLLAGLIDSGIAMAIVGSSRPASGWEHHASHFWDLLAARGRREHASHGLQVGYATRFAMRLQRFAFAGGVASVGPPTAVEDPLGPSAREWLGEPSAEIAAAVREKQQLVADPGAGWPKDDGAWSALCARLAPSLALFDAVERALDIAGIPDAPGWLEIDGDTWRATIRYATRLRSRYTVVDFLEGQGALDAAIEHALAA